MFTEHCNAHCKYFHHHGMFLHIVGQATLLFLALALIGFGLHFLKNKNTPENFMDCFKGYRHLFSFWKSRDGNAQYPGQNGAGVWQQPYQQPVQQQQQWAPQPQAQQPSPPGFQGSGAYQQQQQQWPAQAQPQAPAGYPPQQQMPQPQSSQASVDNAQAPKQ